VSIDAGRARRTLLAGLAVTERRLDLDGVSTTVLEGGDGPPLILLHGAIECGGAVWAPVVARLAATRRLVIPDLPGLGESEPMRRLDALSFARWLRALLRQAGDERPDLVAHSLGGSLAARFAAEHGDSLRRVVVYAAPAIGAYRLPLGLRVVAIRFGLRPSERNAERFDRWAFFDFDRCRERDPAWLEAFSAYTRSRALVPHVKRTMRQLVKAGTERVADAELRRIEIPAALLWGSHDRFVAPRLAEATTARLGWPLHVVDDAGHVPHIERPEAFVRALAAAVDSPRPSGVGVGSSRG
jgi:pimeloyl-ACP methyl ester carboxylesterase